MKMGAGIEKYANELALETAAAVQGLDPNLVKAIAWIESAWNSHAVSSKGAEGLMQIMPATADELGIAHPMDAMENALGGAAYLRQLITRYQGDLWLALCAYNWGPGNVDKARDHVPPAVASYARAVLDQREHFAATALKLPELKPRSEEAHS